MATSRITFQGAVPPWECDIVDHFTVPFYYEKLDQATANAFLAAGIDPTAPNAPRMVRCVTSYSAELRKGDIYRIESMRLGPEKMGHRLINAATNTVCTHFEQTLSASIGELAEDDTSVAADWDGPESADPDHVGDGPHWQNTGRDVMAPKDQSLNGAISASACVHRFSAASDYVRAGIGMTPTYVRENGVGFSTFSFHFSLVEDAAVGTALNTQSCIAHIGKSSLRMVHRLCRAADGVEIARLTQAGVHLDMDARRPSPFPEAIVQQARSVLPGT